MRRYILTDRERRLLRAWLETGEEAEDLPRLFTWIRRSIPRLTEDTDLILSTIRELKRRRRWRGRLTDGDQFGSALRRAESGLTRLRGGENT